MVSISGRTTGPSSFSIVTLYDPSLSFFSPSRSLTLLTGEFVIFQEREGNKKDSKPAAAPAAAKPSAPAAPLEAFIYEYDEEAEGGDLLMLWIHLDPLDSSVYLCAGWVLKGKKCLFLLPRSIEIKEDSKPTSPPTYTVYALVNDPHVPLNFTNINDGCRNKHAELDYTQLEPMFSCVLTDSGLALGTIWKILSVGRYLTPSIL